MNKSVFERKSFGFNLFEKKLDVYWKGSPKATPKTLGSKIFKETTNSWTKDRKV
jgi:hypothetical protein